MTRTLTLDDGVTILTVHPTSLTINETNKAYTMKIPKSDIDYTQIIDRYLGGKLTLTTFEELSFITDVTIDMVLDDTLTYTCIITGFTRDIEAISWSYSLEVIGRSV